jgi:hypothetical protein
LHDLNLHVTDLCVNPVVNGRVGIDGARGSLDVGDRVRAVEKPKGVRIARNNRASPFFKWRKRLLQTGDVRSLAGQGKGTSKERESKTQDPELKLAQNHSGGSARERANEVYPTEMGYAVITMRPPVRFVAPDPAALIHWSTG